MFNEGDYVRIKPEWCDRENQKSLVYVVISVNRKTQRCIISLAWTGLPLPATELVSFEMISKL